MSGIQYNNIIMRTKIIEIWNIIVQRVLEWRQRTGRRSVDRPLTGAWLLESAEYEQRKIGRCSVLFFNVPPKHTNYFYNCLSQEISCIKSTGATEGEVLLPRTLRPEGIQIFFPNVSYWETNPGPPASKCKPQSYRDRQFNSRSFGKAYVLKWTVLF